MSTSSARYAITFDGFDADLLSVGKFQLVSPTSMVVDQHGTEHPSLPIADVPEDLSELWLAGGAGVIEAMRDATVMTSVVNLVERAMRVVAVAEGVVLLGAAGFTQGRYVAVPERLHRRMQVVSPACKISADSISSDGKFLTACEYRGDLINAHRGDAAQR